MKRFPLGALVMALLAAALVGGLTFALYGHGFLALLERIGELPAETRQRSLVLVPLVPTLIMLLTLAWRVRHAARLRERRLRR